MLTVKLANLTVEDTEIDEQKLPEKPTQERDGTTGRYLKKSEPTVPLSPSISSISSLPVTPRSQSPPTESTEPPTQPTTVMAPTTEEKLFRGDYSAGEKPHIWFRRLEGKFDEDTKLATKLYRFAKNLEPGRPAELWY